MRIWQPSPVSGPEQATTVQSSTNFRDEARALLAQGSLFAGLPEDARTQLLSHAHIKTIARGSPIFRMGDPGDSLVAVLSGDVRISIASSEGRQITLARASAGEILGEIALLDGRERTADATAETPCTIAVLGRRDVLPILERHPSALLQIVKMLCERLRRTDQHLAEVALMPLCKRLAGALLRLSESGSGGRSVKLSQRAIGEIVGASRESVNKCLAEWQRDDWIRIDGPEIKITDADALQDLAEIE
ncbi:MAG: family transcriptional regulator, cyclic receptor protein [Variibacter sp.]|jgi:CRP-like cAMP-binding protein|nr:family transcriptional regulator, cyclic receptor protein [Variibacter sp.]